MSENARSAGSVERADLESARVSRKTIAGWVLSVWITLVMVLYFKQFSSYVVIVMDWLVGRLRGG